MKYLSPQQVLLIHDQVIKRFGGSFGIRDIGLLESAVARPQASFDSEELYETIFEKTAALMHSLLKNHPFIDGNKRTALASSGIFLQINDYKLLHAYEKELDFAKQVENETLSFENIADWFETNSGKIK